MTKRMAIAALALTGVFVSLYLTLYKLGVIGHMACSVGSCETVQLSEWATLAGVPVAAWGVSFYIATLAVTMLGVQDRWSDSPRISQLLALMSGSGVLFSAYLTYLEAFVINAWCQWCVVSAIIVTVIFALSVLDLLEVRRGVPRDDAPDEELEDTGFVIRDS
ncbi:MAG TPA: vitamin K epoxide reductase family protein [Gemmatimonadaceae bacterium]|nr:vitamin K epoxide reductase family protein [Gemmatimonadaceae bacterium]